MHADRPSPQQPRPHALTGCEPGTRTIPLTSRALGAGLPPAPASESRPASQPAPSGDRRRQRRRPNGPRTSARNRPGLFGIIGRNAAYAATGFIVGVVFWHAVGFWSFVSEAVLSGPRPQIESTVAAEGRPFERGQSQTATIETGSIAAAPEGAPKPLNTTAADPLSPARALPMTDGGKLAAPLNRTADPALQPLPTGTLNCADLALDRTSGAVTAGDCDLSSAGTPKPAAASPQVEAWATRTATAEPAPRQDRFTTSVTPTSPAPAPQQQRPGIAAQDGTTGWNTAIEPPQLPQLPQW